MMNRFVQMLMKYVDLVTIENKTRRKARKNVLGSAELIFI